VEIITFPQACLGVDFFALFQAFYLIFYRLFPVCLLTSYRWTLQKNKVPAVIGKHHLIK
jgi:hypothetical protein